MKKTIYLILLLVAFSSVKSYSQTVLNNFGKPAKIYICGTNEKIYADEVGVVIKTETNFVISGDKIVRDGLDESEITPGEKPELHKGELYSIDRNYGTGGKWLVICNPDPSFCAFTWGAIAIAE